MTRADEGAAAGASWRAGTVAGARAHIRIALPVWQSPPERQSFWAACHHQPDLIRKSGFDWIEACLAGSSTPPLGTARIQRDPARSGGIWEDLGRLGRDGGAQPRAQSTNVKGASDPTQIRVLFYTR